MSPSESASLCEVGVASSSMISLFRLRTGWASTSCVWVVALAGVWGWSVSLEELVGVGLRVSTLDTSWVASGRLAWSESWDSELPSCCSTKKLSAGKSSSYKTRVSRQWWLDQWHQINEDLDFPKHHLLALRWLDRVMQDHEARARDHNRKLIFSFFLLFS